MCGKDLSIIAKRSAEEVNAVSRIYVNCKLFLLNIYLHKRRKL